MPASRKGKGESEILQVIIFKRFDRAILLENQPP